MRRDVFERAGGADERLQLAGDQLTWIRMLLISDVAYVARPLNYFRQHPGTVRRSAVKQGLGILDGYEIAAFLRDALPLEPRELDAACEQLLHSWSKKALRLRNRIPLRTSLRIDRRARQVDPRLRRRMLRRLLGGRAAAGARPAGPAR